MISDTDPGDKVPSPARPRLRPVEAFPVRHQGRDVIGLRDPGRIAPGVLFLEPAAAFILQLLNGRNDLRDIQLALLRKTGALIEMDKIEGLIRVLDENYFLEGDRFDRHWTRVRQEFAASSSRPAGLAGASYPADPAELAAALTSFDGDPAGPGEPEPVPSSGVPRGLVAPHIDFPRGGPGYAWAYRQMPAENPPDLAVILGTAHHPTQNLLVLTDKDFETPFGPARCDRELASQILARTGGWIKADEFVHRGEHSIEFQAVWLMHHFARAETLRILPVLCGSFQGLMDGERTPEDAPDYMNGLDTIKMLLGECVQGGRTVTIVASADLSHVGAQFGDRFAVSEGVKADVRQYDRDMLALVEQGNYGDLFTYVARARDRTHVCGLAPLYTLLRLIEPATGRLLSYQQWVDPKRQGMVSFASLVFP